MEFFVGVKQLYLKSIAPKLKPYRLSIELMIPCYLGLEPNLEFEILKTESNTARRKIAEAMLILKFKPRINKRDELETIKRFLVTST